MENQFRTKSVKGMFESGTKFENLTMSWNYCILKVNLYLSRETLPTVLGQMEGEIFLTLIVRKTPSWYDSETRRWRIFQ